MISLTLPGFGALTYGDLHLSPDSWQRWPDGDTYASASYTDAGTPIVDPPPAPLAYRARCRLRLSVSELAAFQSLAFEHRRRLDTDAGDNALITISDQVHNLLEPTTAITRSGTACDPLSPAGLCRYQPQLRGIVIVAEAVEVRGLSGVQSHWEQSFAFIETAILPVPVGGNVDPFGGGGAGTSGDTGGTGYGAGAGGTTATSGSANTGADGQPVRGVQTFIEYAEDGFADCKAGVEPLHFYGFSNRNYYAVAFNGDGTKSEQLGPYAGPVGIRKAGQVNPTPFQYLQAFQVFYRNSAGAYINAGTVKGLVLRDAQTGNIIGGDASAFVIEEGSQNDPNPPGSSGIKQLTFCGDPPA